MARKFINGCEKNIGTPSPSKCHSRVPLPSKNFLSTSSGQQVNILAMQVMGRKGCCGWWLQSRSAPCLASHRKKMPPAIAKYCPLAMQMELWRSKTTKCQPEAAKSAPVVVVVWPSTMLLIHWWWSCGLLQQKITKQYETAMKQWWLSITSSEIKHPSLNGYKPGLLHGATRDMSGTHGLQNATPQDKLACQCQLAPYQHFPSGSFPK